MLNDVLLLLSGLLLIIKGGDLFVAAAIRVAEFLRMPRVVIGSTLVSLTTTTPELVVSIMAGIKGEPGLAVGNAVGSVICNIGLILGITATIKQVDIHFGVLRRPLLVMLGAGVLLLIMTVNLELAHWQGWILLSGGAAFFIWDFATHWRNRKPADLAEAKAIEEGVSITRFAWLQTPWGSGVQFFAGAAVVIIGSRLLVDGAVDVAIRLGISSVIVGLTVVAIGTSLPELVTAVTSSRKSVSDLAVGNVLGANIANLTLVVGVAAVVQEVRMGRVTQLFNFPAMLVVMAVLVWMLWTDRRLSRKEGIALVSLYGLYLAALIAITFLFKP
jgi:cation:H+ antiporter